MPKKVVPITSLFWKSQNWFSCFKKFFKNLAFISFWGFGLFETAFGKSWPFNFFWTWQPCYLSHLGRLQFTVWDAIFWLRMLSGAYRARLPSSRLRIRSSSGILMLFCSIYHKRSRKFPRTPEVLKVPLVAWVSAGGQEGTLAGDLPPSPSAGQNSMFFDFFLKKIGLVDPYGPLKDV